MANGDVGAAKAKLPLRELMAQYGYALHLKDGLLVFTVRIDGKPTAITSPAEGPGKGAISATLGAGGLMSLTVNGTQVATGQATGLIPKQPQDALSIGEDAGTAVGDYEAPNPLSGKITNIRISTR